VTCLTPPRPLQFILLSVLLRTDAYPYDGLMTAGSFLLGSFLSASAGWIGMSIATQANSRTAEACKVSISRGLEVSFASGSVMGLCCCGLGLLGLSGLLCLFGYTTTGSTGALPAPVRPPPRHPR
jgi:Na+/H+-translocating membrane pyrophosphatase